MSEMEQDAKDFLKRIVWSLSAGMLFLTINSTAGIKHGLFFFENSPSFGNYLFYLWMLISTGLLVFFLRKWWKRKFPHG
jgi:hypothetical protein